MKPNYLGLGAILYSQYQYVTPVFQRYYRWEEPQWNKLWQNALELRQPDKTGKHFMGFLAFVPVTPQPGGITTFYIIDGQQRLTTLSLALVALRDQARAQDYIELAQEIEDNYLLHPHRKGAERFRLFPKGADKDAYVGVIEGNNRGGRISSALQFFREGLSQLFPKPSESDLRSFLELLTQRLEFMCATLEHDNDDAYNIYKSLNSTGVPLGAADLIRNFVFMHVPPEDQDEFDSTLWLPLEAHFQTGDGTLDANSFSAFLRDFLMRDGKYVNDRATAAFDAFEERYEDTHFSPNELTKQLNIFAGFYETVRGGHQDTCMAVTEALSRLNKLKSTTPYPLLLSLFARRAQRQISDVGLADAIEMLSGFILRRFVCGESSRPYGRMFVHAALALGDKPVEQLRCYLEEMGYPDAIRFRNSFIGFNLYQKQYDRFILECLERSHGHKEQADLSKTEIEHIMPQTLSEQWRNDLGKEADRIYTTWLHTPGNLTLSAYNEKLWNSPFAVKKNLYKDSNIVLTRQLAEIPTWDEAAIRKRGEELADRAIQIWKGPAVPPAIPTREQRLQKRIEATQRKIALLKQKMKSKCS